MIARTAAIATSIAAALAACAGARPAPPAAPPARPPVASAPPDAGSDGAAPGEAVPTLEALATRGPTDMPLMREALRSEDATTPSVVEAGTADTCFRAVVAASTPVRAWFEDEKHTPRGAELTSATTGLVPPRGPACARKGEKLRLVIDPQAAPITARAIVWQAP